MCHSTMPAHTDTFKECLVPVWGTTTQASLAAITGSDTPDSSLPKTTASFSQGPGRHASKGTARTVYSTLTTR